MRVSIHQTHYLPWLRYFDKIARSDVFVLLDDIQFNRNGWQNRNKIKGPAGPLLLTVPVLQHYQQNLSQVRINSDVQWARKHWRSIEQTYRRAPWFDRYQAGLRTFYETRYERLVELNEAMLRWFLQELGIETRLVVSHELAVEEISTDRLISICQRLGATEYLTGAYAMGAYLDVKAFETAGIGLVSQHWTSPIYDQLYPAVPYVPDLSVVDILLNHGPQARDIVLRGGSVRAEQVHA